MMMGRDGVSPLDLSPSGARQRLASLRYGRDAVSPYL